MKKLWLLLLLLPVIAVSGIPQRFGDGLIVGTYLYPKTDGLDLGSSTKKWNSWLNTINGTAISLLTIPTGSTTTQYFRGGDTPAWATLDTSVVPENGSLFFTNARARAAISVGSGLGYDATYGAITCVLASGSTAGCLSSSDWSTFNSKQDGDAELSAIAGLTSAADKLPYFTGSGAAALTDFTSFARTFLAAGSSALARIAMGLQIGVDVQGYDAELAALGGLTSAADKIPYFTGSGAASTADFTSFGRTLVGGASAGAANTSLGLGPTTVAISGTDIDWTGGASQCQYRQCTFTKTLSASSTYTFSNRQAGQTIVVRFTNTASNYTVTWPTVKWCGSSTPTMTTGAKSDIYTFNFDGTDVFGCYTQNH